MKECQIRERPHDLRGKPKVGTYSENQKANGNNPAALASSHQKELALTHPKGTAKALLRSRASGGQKTDCPSEMVLVPQFQTSSPPSNPTGSDSEQSLSQPQEEDRITSILQLSCWF